MSSSSAARSRRLTNASARMPTRYRAAPARYGLRPPCGRTGRADQCCRSKAIVTPISCAASSPSCSQSTRTSTPATSCRPTPSTCSIAWVCASTSRRSVPTASARWSNASSRMPARRWRARSCAPWEEVLRLDLPLGGNLGELIEDRNVVGAVHAVQPFQLALAKIDVDMLFQPGLFQAKVISYEAKPLLAAGRPVVAEIADFRIDLPGVVALSEPLHQGQRHDFGVSHQ